jgi:nucleoside-diphosphate-sugar epimerase
MRQHFLITGAQGFIGRYFGCHLLQSDAEAEILGIGRSRLFAGSFTHDIHFGQRYVRAPLPPELVACLSSPRYKYESLDIREEDRLCDLLADFAPSVVVHLASCLRGDLQENLDASNVQGTQSVVQAIARSKITLTNFVLASTGGVYGVPNRLPLSEDAACNPADPYAASKLAAEQAALRIAAHAGIPLVVARIFNVIGAGEDERHAPGKFARDTLRILRKEVAPLLETGSLYPTRDFIDVRDAATALGTISSRGVPAMTYNVGSGVEVSIRSILDLILDASGLRGKVSIQETISSASVRRHFADISRLKDLGFRPRYSLEESVRCLCEYYFHSVGSAMPVQVTESAISIPIGCA